MRIKNLVGRFERLGVCIYIFFFIYDREIGATITRFHSIAELPGERPEGDWIKRGERAEGTVEREWEIARKKRHGYQARGQQEEKKRRKETISLGGESSRKWFLLGLYQSALKSRSEPHQFELPNSRLEPQVDPWEGKSWD